MARKVQFAVIVNSDGAVEALNRLSFAYLDHAAREGWEAEEHPVSWEVERERFLRELGA